MTFGLTDSGFKAKKFTDLLADSAVDLKRELGIDIDTNPDAIAKVITNIFNLALSEPWAAVEDMQSMFDIDSAEGKHLDDLVGYIRMERLPAKAAFGDAYIGVGIPMLQYPLGTILTDVSGKEYTTTSDISTTGDSKTVRTTLTVSNVVGTGDNLTIGIGGIAFSETIALSIPDAVTNLVSSVNARTSETDFVATTTTEGSVYTIILTKQDDTVTGSITYLDTLVLVESVSPVPIIKSEYSSAEVPAGSVYAINNNSNVVSVSNRYAFTGSSAAETDAELRKRHKLVISTAGASTIPAIYSALNQVSGVTDTIIVENDTMGVVDSVPAKSIMCVVKGGADSEIGEALWKNKPAGIETYGNVGVEVSDSFSNTKVVSFSRPTPIYVHLNVDYGIHPELSSNFPLDGEAQILKLVNEYGEALAIGVDILPNLFEAKILSTVGGLWKATITMGTTTTAGDATPALSTDIVPIAPTAEAYFSTSRITVSGG